MVGEVTAAPASLDGASVDTTCDASSMPSVKRHGKAWDGFPAEVAGTGVVGREVSNRPGFKSHCVKSRCMKSRCVKARCVKSRCTKSGGFVRTCVGAEAVVCSRAVFLQAAVVGSSVIGHVFM